MSPHARFPFCPADLAAAAIEAVPGRLQRRIDALVADADGWVITTAGELIMVRPSSDVTVTLTVAAGVVAEARCDCLLAPRCAHRAAVLSACPTPDGADAVDVSPEEPQTLSTVPVTAAMRSAAEQLWKVGAGLLIVGSQAAGPAERAGWLRAVHGARIAGLHRAAAAGTMITNQLQYLATGSVRADTVALARDLGRLLADCWTLTHADQVDPAVIGVGRRAYHAENSLQVWGFGCEPVVT